MDDAAVLVTQLSHQETRQTIEDRFSKYGEIFEVEMELSRQRSRVMFKEKKAAFDAIQYEVRMLPPPR